MGAKVVITLVEIKKADKTTCQLKSQNIDALAILSGCKAKEPIFSECQKKPFLILVKSIF